MDIMTGIVTVSELSFVIKWVSVAWFCTQILFSALKHAGMWNPRRLPPGPFPLPVVGNLFSLAGFALTSPTTIKTTPPHISVAEISKRYGPLVSLQLGSLTTVVVSSPELARKVCQEHDAVLSHRQIRHTTTISGQHLASVVFLPPGPKWRLLRKVGTFHVFATSRLDGGKNLRRNKVQDLLAYASECSATSTPVNISQAAFTTSLNILSNTFFSMDLADLSSSHAAHELKALVSAMMAEGGTPNIADFFPVLRPIDPQGIHRRATVVKERILKVFDGIIEKRMQERLLKKDRDLHEDKDKDKDRDRDRDVLDTLIRICDNHINVHEEDQDGLRFADIRIILLDLFVAGTDTTSSTVEWALSELLRNPDKLKKAQAELDLVIGKGNQVDDDHVSRLPYLRAIIKETLRLHPPVPFLVPRKSSADVEVSDYVIPKDSQVWINVWAMGRDETVWENATRFEPERFLSPPKPEPEIDYRGQSFQLIPFGSGRRVCLGLPLAHRVMHAVLGSLISSFDWNLNLPLLKELDMEERFGFTLHKANPLCAVPLHR